MARVWHLLTGNREPQDGWPASMRGWREWVEGAATLDNRTLAHRMYELAGVLNRRRMAPAKRLRVLELVRPCVWRTFDYLGGRIQSQPLPLPPRARAAYNLATGLIQEFTYAYERALNEEGGRLNRRQFALACERTLALYGERMLRSAQNYTDLESGFWQGANAVYCIAERVGVAARPVEAAAMRGRAGARQSPVAMYKRLLLFALAGTQGFRRGEAARLYCALESWHDRASLGPVDPDEASSLPRFAVDVESGGGPHLLAAGDTAPSVRVLEVNDLVLEVEQLRSERGPQNNPVPAADELSPLALARLIDSWRPGNYKRSQRARRGSEVDVELTLAVIHSRISVESRPPAQPDSETAGSESSAEQFAAPEEWTIEGLGGPGEEASQRNGARGGGLHWQEIPHGRNRSAGYEEARALEEGSPRPGEYACEPRWLLEDVSRSGFRLVWDGAGSCRACVGEPVALRIGRDAQGQSRWCVGLTRRMRFLDERRFEIGVELLARKALAVGVRAGQRHGGSARRAPAESSTPGLLLPADRKRGTTTALLLPANVHSGGEVLELDLRDRTMRVTLGRLHEDTGAISRYELAPAPEQARRAAGARSSQQWFASRA